MSQKEENNLKGEDTNKLECSFEHETKRQEADSSVEDPPSEDPEVTNNEEDAKQDELPSLEDVDIDKDGILPEQPEEELMITPRMGPAMLHSLAGGGLGGR